MESPSPWEFPKPVISTTMPNLSVIEAAEDMAAPEAKEEAERLFCALRPRAASARAFMSCISFSARLRFSRNSLSSPTVPGAPPPRAEVKSGREGVVSETLSLASAYEVFWETASPAASTSALAAAICFSRPSASLYISDAGAVLSFAGVGG